VTPAALLTAAVQETLGAVGPLGGIVIEITEQAAVQDYGLLIAAVEALRERGALVAVDDMGAGHASLSHVLQLRPDFVGSTGGWSPTATATWRGWPYS